ncbi:oligopeptide transport system ATP-binding protein [Aureimonas altamirensis DSM 21988]|uniref:Oligopeptide transport system ATP-binding protein n=2 Tax=Aureimonas altamirensis TaxID=370622 RepID=A0ABY1IHT5_9HYPH|nr:oligopeptide transport system ATP-binding protein [Aureimonas altamirensis DSM 21988]
MSDDDILTLTGLDVTFATEDGPVHAARGVSFGVRRGETLAVVGESGSGKSQTMMAVMGLLAANGHATGSARYHGTELIGLPPKELNRYRGARISMIFQEPMTSLDPLYTVGRQIREVIRHHNPMPGRAARARALELLALVGIPEPERRIDAYPHELSGGQRQRVMIAMALANEPELLIADEPTTALDVTVQAQILDLIASLQKRLGMAVLLITHDLGVVRNYASRVVVMRRGEVVETGPASTIFDHPQHDYTRMLIAAEPAGRKPPVPAGTPSILSARDVSVDYLLRGNGFLRGTRLFRAVDKISLDLKRGQTIGIVGESGSGKSTLGRAILRLVPSEGRILFEGQEIGTRDKAAMRPLRRELQLMFQDPYGSLSPRLTVGEVITEGLLVHEPSIGKAERDRRAAAALEEVGLPPSARNRYPHEFSGGQRQRIAIARAIILKPKVIVLDEPTSALDRSVQVQIVALLRKLQDEHGLSYVFISHDLSVVRAMSDHIMVMKDGMLMEEGGTDDIFTRPKADYTRSLIAAAFQDVRAQAAARVSSSDAMSMTNR